MEGVEEARECDGIDGGGTWRGNTHHTRIHPEHSSSERDQGARALGPKSSEGYSRGDLRREIESGLAG